METICMLDPNYKDRIINNLPVLFNNQNFADCVLVVPNSEERIHANRGILAANGIIVESAFQTQRSLQQNKPNFVVPVENFETLKSLTQFWYTGRIILNDQTIEAILRAAILLKINELLPLCNAYVSRRLNPSNCLHFLGIVTRLLEPQYQMPVKRFVIEHFDEVCETEAFGAVDYKVFAEFLRHARFNLGVGTYGKINVTIDKWCRYDEKGRESLKPLLQYYISCDQIVAGPSTSLVEQMIARSPKLVAVVQNLTSIEVYGYDFNLQPLSNNTGYKIRDVHETHSLHYISRLNFCLVLFSGREGQIDEVVEFDVIIQTFRWLSVPPGINNWNGCFEVAEIGGQMYILGYSKAKEEFAMQRWDPILRRWDDISNAMPPIRFVFSDFTAVSFQNSLYVSYKQSINCIFHKYTPTTNQWIVLQPITFGGTLCNGQQILLTHTKETVQLLVFTADDIKVFKYTPSMNEWAKVEIDMIQGPIDDVYTFKNNQDSFIFFKPTNLLRKYDEDAGKWVSVAHGLACVGKKPFADILFLPD